MIKNLTIRGGLTLVIGLFIAFLLAVIGVAYGALKLTNDSLREAQHGAASLASLKTSSEKLLQVRLELASYETRFSAGKATDAMLDHAHRTLTTSTDEFRRYAGGPFADADEARLAGTVAQARAALVEKALEPEYKAMQDYDFNTFRTIQGETADQYYGVYATAIDALEQWHAARQKREADEAVQRFRVSLAVFGAIGVIGIAIGLIARAGLAASVVKPVDQAIRHFERIAAGDLTVGVEVHSRNEMGRLLGALVRMRDGLVQTVSRVRGGTEQIARGANEIAAGNADLSGRTSQQAAALQQTAASLEQLSAAVRNNAASAKEANGLAQGALDTVSRGTESVVRVAETMSDISTSSRKVADITGIIEGIAFQTNILALNAAVEAARAGEEGRGFAVVASEVRSLAQRSGTAAKEIKALIEESGASVEQGTKLVDDARHTMEQARGAVDRVSGIMREIEAATHEQSDGIEQLNRAVAQIDEVTQRNAALVEESASAAQALQMQADGLREAVSAFRTEAGADGYYGEADDGRRVGDALAADGGVGNVRAVMA
ncbi:methyl-accepting chemotaxis protein [Paraburkholderia caballeronis]|uniref:methyl-accepting chemotaxis protein n=1 Tax=Paraburkholderia caballeronis TaxID=416943 RepID=UPI00106606FF|nr:methyl-accepting chemotaxis protein [Paraburkholderia caballeronis]TDV09226.1 methyl-accepting chemotaxis sensory transducer with TarH sensor [Paraburkholderia caballeronis]TDV12286.1 methyl-accepting chemotaxis sensory transducer with TarH sensor [Paraburkholderia caballeronis]TDV22759.1 methyl-accepting chemotaxis sensory transducer with TarH sensor [Paraburkholderia caballeronis]